jgi:hypothetical protein
MEIIKSAYARIIENTIIKLYTEEEKEVLSEFTVYYKNVIINFDNNNNLIFTAEQIVSKLRSNMSCTYLEDITDPSLMPDEQYIHTGYKGFWDNILRRNPKPYVGPTYYSTFSQGSYKCIMSNWKVIFPNQKQILQK